LSNLLFKAIKGISYETGDAFFNARSHETTIIPAEILFPVIGDLIDPATDQKGDAMAHPNNGICCRRFPVAIQCHSTYTFPPTKGVLIIQIDPMLVVRIYCTKDGFTPLSGCAEKIWSSDSHRSIEGI